MEMATPPVFLVTAQEEPVFVEPEGPKGLGGLFGKKKHAEAVAAARADCEDPMDRVRELGDASVPLPFDRITAASQCDGQRLIETIYGLDVSGGGNRWTTVPGQAAYACDPDASPVSAQPSEADWPRIVGPPCGTSGGSRSLPRRWKNAPKEPASIPTAEIAHACRKTSSTRAGVVIGFGS
jgi:hypothetical protein